MLKSITKLGNKLLYKVEIYNCKNTVIKPNMSVINIVIVSFLFKFLNKVILILNFLNNLYITNKHKYTTNKKTSVYNG